MSNVITENIVNLVKDQLSDPIVDQIKGALGDEGPKASSAIGSFLPAILSGVTDLAGSSKGAEKLYSTVSKQDDFMLDNIGVAMREGQSSTVIDQGSNLLGSLFGGNGVDKLGNVLSSFSGVSRGKSASLMGILAPMILGVIKKKFMGGVSNANGLASLLQSQKTQISAAMPSGLADQLQTSGFLGNSSKSANEPNSLATDYVSNTVNTTQHTDTHNVEKSFNWKKYLIPVGALAALVIIAMNFLGGSSDNVNDTVSDTTGAATDAAATTTETATGAATDAAATATEAVEGAAGSIDIEGVGGQLTDMFGGATDALSGITDVASAEAAVPALQSAGENLGGLSGQLEKIPEAARGPLTSIITNGVSALQPLIESATAIPGVGPIIEPIVNPMMETLQGFAG